MFTPKGFFSGIVCPYREKCLLPGCIFAHSPPGLVSSSKAVTATSSKKEYDVTVIHEAEKTSQSDEASISKERIEATKPVVRPKERAFISATVSPPPIRRKALNGNSMPVSKEASAAVVPTGPKAKQPVNQEALHPRTLAFLLPVKFTTRVQLLGLVYAQLLRLNSELAKDANDEEEKLVLTDQQIITFALDIEEGATITPSIYGNVLKNRLMSYKKMAVPAWKEERAKEFAKEKAKEAVKTEQVAKAAGVPIVIETGLTENEELNLLHKLLTPIEHLTPHGYVTSIPPASDIKDAKKGLQTAGGWESCDRCKSRFQVFPGRREEDGALTVGTCTYHFGKPYWIDRATSGSGKREKKYRCCGEGYSDSAGCTKAETHVFKVSEVKRLAALLNFEKTPINMEKISDRPVCIDGEMGYTAYGLELVRITATSWPTGKPLFDVLVRPFGEILDLNSRYSGVWPADIANALPYDPSSPEPHLDLTTAPLRIVASPASARTLLFTHLTPLTPLIGHGLENDLNAIRVIHPTIIDTALLYPHRAGLPYRNGLKALMQTHLNRDIQVVVEGKGHDSKEDANAAGELVRLKLARVWMEMQVKGWTVEFGVFNAPLPEGEATVIRERERKREREEVEREDERLGGLNYG
ncbi:RNA exonuclease-like protein Rex3 [Calycina marina]|uniref:RNA exonuclease-like protein Rex3 n=1 Tax=Calycina marina TaxID=1763456 RepID=A0A9P8CIQ8_9HELO|nr:RNA exonuclease-like protein Rex3 [Calycina marina]